MGTRKKLKLRGSGNQWKRGQIFSKPVKSKNFESCILWRKKGRVLFFVFSIYHRHHYQHCCSYHHHHVVKLVIIIKFISHWLLSHHFYLASFPTYLQQICKVRIFSQALNRRDVERCLVMSSLLSSPCLALAFTSTAKKRVQTKLTWQVTSVDNSKGQVPSVKQEWNKEIVLEGSIYQDWQVLICHASFKSFVTWEKLASQPGTQTQGPSWLRSQPKILGAWFPLWQAAKLLNPPDSRCSGFPLLPPLHSTPGQLPASTNRAAGTPTNQSGAKICADQSESRVDTGQTIVLGSGCIPSKADLLEHRPITCPDQATWTVRRWTRCQNLKTASAGRKVEGGVDESGVCCQGAVDGSTPRTAFPHVLLTTSPSHNRVSAIKIQSPQHYQCNSCNTHTTNKQIMHNAHVLLKTSCNIKTLPFRHTHTKHIPLTQKSKPKGWTT